MNDTVLEVFKWIALALAAGFVGYFGRYLAMQIIEKSRRKKQPLPSSDAPPDSVNTSETSLKTEKKKAKAGIKKAKKAQKESN